MLQPKRKMPFLLIVFSYCSFKTGKCIKLLSCLGITVRTDLRFQSRVKGHDVVVRSHDRSLISLLFVLKKWNLFALFVS